MGNSELDPAATASGSNSLSDCLIDDLLCNAKWKADCSTKSRERLNLKAVPLKAVTPVFLAEVS